MALVHLEMGVGDVHRLGELRRALSALQVGAKSRPSGTIVDLGVRLLALPRPVN